MNKFNRIILWSSLLTPILVAAGVKLPFRFLRPDNGSDAVEIITAVSLMASYTILVAGIIAVGASTYGNLSLRREHASLQTAANRWYFNAGVAYCIVGVAFILFPVL
jgi:hypothetical protein